MAEPLLELRDVVMRFGGVVAIDGLDLHVDEGEILGLIGPNGAGKTTVFNVVTGVFEPTAGAVVFAGQDLKGVDPHTICSRGIARTFQNIRLFHNMSALENVQVGADAQHRTSVVGAVVGVGRHRTEEREGRELARELLDFMGLSRRAEDLAKNLPYGDQRRLEIARALATKPRLILLDEPAAGFNPREKDAMLELIGRIRDRGHTVLLIEHDMELVMGISDRVVVLEFGSKIADAPPAQVQTDQRVIDAYLGVPADDDEDDAAIGAVTEES